MSALVKLEGRAVALPRADLVRVLGNSLYPGASSESIELVLGYCEAAGLDPMLKPCHIVPMYDRNIKGMRDVVMPGIGLYRTQASRTGQFAGMSEAEFGPMKTEKIGGVEIEYPEWARVTVKRRLDSGDIAEFTAVEFWRENYAVKGGPEKSIAPNSMWTRRPRGQLAKCAQAQALRVAFPELGAGATADEMEGKPLQGSETIEMETIVSLPPDLLAQAKEAADKGRAGFEAFWKTLPRETRLLFQHEIDALKVRTEDAEKRLTGAAEAKKGESSPVSADSSAPAAAAEGQGAAQAEPASATDEFVADMERAEREPGFGPDDVAPRAKGEKARKS